ncbi:hypothetical protein HK102_004034 [Quaeritorhiza haematococci]|nr:hypothetical protein HK102_004034 [Quaeritorhiza haematococci]
MNSDEIEKVLPHFKVRRSQQITSLWAGYGSIHRIHGTSKQSGKKACTLILKRVSPPADGEGVSHARKLRSYQVERAFYTMIAEYFNACDASLMQRRGEMITQLCPLPQPLWIAPVSETQNQNLVIIMTDLQSDFPDSRSFLDERHTKTALRWLAGFHTSFWELEGVNTSLWEDGCYWHLDTRMEEWESMSGGGSWGELKRKARSLDLRLKGFPDGKLPAQGGRPKDTRFRTLVHGDAKSANIMFSSDGERAAFYDFQYVGEGYGVRDVVYLLTSSVDGALLRSDEGERKLLEFYYQELMKNLELRGVNGRDEYTFDEMWKHYEYALADYVRFMVGWGMWGNDRWACRRTKEILAKWDCE